MPGINHDGGSVDMVTEGVTASAGRTRTIGADFDSAWKAAASQIRAAQDKLVGNDKMSLEVMPKVHTATGQIMPVADQIKAKLDQCAAAADKAVADYTAADARGASAMPNG